MNTAPSCPSVREFSTLRELRRALTVFSESVLRLSVAYSVLSRSLILPRRALLIIFICFKQIKQSTNAARNKSPLWSSAVDSRRCSARLCFSDRIAASGGQGAPRYTRSNLTNLHLVHLDRIPPSTGPPFSCACLVFTPQRFSIYCNSGVMICIMVDKCGQGWILGFFLYLFS